MNAEDISIDKIHRHQNVRVDPLTKERDVASLMASIKQFGLFHPIHITKDGPGVDTYSIILGNRRLVACKKLEWTTIPAFVHYDIMEYKEFLLRNTSENLERKNVDELELGRIFDELHTAPEVEMEPSEISARFSLPITRVKRAMQLYREVPEKYRNKIKYMPDGGRLGRGKKYSDIPAHTAQKIVNMTKRRGLGKYKNDLWNLASKDDFTGKDFNILALLLNRKFTLDEALQTLDSCKIISMKIIVDKKSFKRLKQKYKIPAIQLISKIISGDVNDRIKTVDLDVIKQPRKKGFFL